MRISLVWAFSAVGYDDVARPKYTNLRLVSVDFQMVAMPPPAHTRFTLAKPRMVGRGAIWEGTFSGPYLKIGFPCYFQYRENPLAM